MSIVRSLTAAAAVGLCLLPLPSAAVDDIGVQPPEVPSAAKEAAQSPLNQITVGGAWQSNRSAYFGRYNGHPDNGFYGIGGFSLQGGDAWDSGRTRYWSFQGNDLGFDTRSFSLRVGEQGTWGLNFYYDGIPYTFSNSFQSVWSQSGILVAGVAPGSVANATTLASRLNTLDIATQRNIFGIVGKYQWGDWTITGGLRHENKTGYKANSVYFGPSPISPTAANITTGAFAYFAEPVNYDTDRYDLTADLGRELWQVRVGYTFNRFEAGTTSLSLANPFAFTTGYGGPASRVGAVYSLPPSNSAHQVRAEFGYNFTPTTRLNANFAYGLMAQDAPFPSVTGNSNLPAVGQPRSSLDGAIQTVFGNVALTARPLPKMDVRLSYTIDDRASLTPRDQFNGYVGDTAPSPITFPPGRFNLPLSYRNQAIKAEAGYGLAPETKVTLTYAYDATHRTYADTNDVTQNSVTAKLRTAVIEGLFGSLSYTHADREAHNYNRNGPFIALTGSPTATNDFIGLVKFYEASRVRDEVKGTLDYAPLRDLSTMLSVKFRNDHYPASALGLRDNYNFSAGPDIGWQINKKLSLHAYYAYERYFYEQNGAYFTSTSCNSNGLTLTAACNGLWNGQTTDDSHTAGINVQWQPLDEFKVNVDYAFNYGNAAYSLANGGLLALGGVANVSNVVAPGPTVRTMLNTVTIRGEYMIRPNISLIGAYTFASFSDNDYAYNQTAAQYTNALFSGDTKPAYTVHMVLAAITMRF